MLACQRVRMEQTSLYAGPIVVARTSFSSWMDSAIVFNTKWNANWGESQVVASDNDAAILGKEKSERKYLDFRALLYKT